VIGLLTPSCGRRADRVYFSTMVAHSAILRLALVLATTTAMPVVAKPVVLPRPQVAHYKAITSDEAGTLIAKLDDAQSRIKAGEDLTFELLSGAPASYPAAKISPRQSFLAMNFGQPYAVERLPTTGLWQHYQLTYFPPEPDALMWKVDVTTGQLAELVRVEMLYTAPPPF
jgi:hypothetical protein